MRDRAEAAWLPIAPASALKKDGVLPVIAFGRECVLFRTKNKKLHLWDAHCPHLGAHLGHGGKVVGESIRCPFHGWRFASDTGEVEHVPYVERMPRCKVRSHAARESDGTIYGLVESDASD